MRALNEHGKLIELGQVPDIYNIGQDLINAGKVIEGEAVLAAWHIAHDAMAIIEDRGAAQLVNDPTVGFKIGDAVYVLNMKGDRYIVEGLATVKEVIHTDCYKVIFEGEDETPVTRNVFLEAQRSPHSYCNELNQGARLAPEA